MLIKEEGAWMNMSNCFLVQKVLMLDDEDKIPFQLLSYLDSFPEFDTSQIHVEHDRNVESLSSSVEEDNSQNSTVPEYHIHEIEESPQELNKIKEEELEQVSKKQKKNKSRVVRKRMKEIVVHQEKTDNSGKKRKRNLFRKTKKALLTRLLSFNFEKYMIDPEFTQNGDAYLIESSFQEDDENIQNSKDLNNEPINQRKSEITDLLASLPITFDQLMNRSSTSPQKLLVQLLLSVNKLNNQGKQQLSILPDQDGKITIAKKKR
eukprot:TRINITY_DN2584_c0_g1_i2.p1 TRINITY_DN2584_c0_g1~~TRINITY_DN2584_c0_g1_i2.p1  ORF type:complete len:263 (+),score=63.17 TRINITY_DN2584_c0_g1_i2:870-1658(+)